MSSELNPTIVWAEESGLALRVLVSDAGVQFSILDSDGRSDPTVIASTTVAHYRVKRIRDALVDFHKHAWVCSSSPEDPGAWRECSCGEHDGWWCPDSEDHRCVYSETEDQCDFCGAPEERK